jgi:hypothetical protein
MPIHHPVAWAAASGLALVGLNRAKWKEGTARVRLLESGPEGLVLVEMDDDNIFVTDPEYLQSLHSAHQTQTPVRYWINNFQRLYGRPRGGLGDVSLAKRS